MDRPNDLAGERIRTARLIFGLTQNELAGAIGVTQGLISAVESGAKAASRDLLESAESALGVPRSFFEVIPNELPLGSLRFRKKTGASRTETRRAEALFVEEHRVSTELCRHGKYPTPDLPTISETPSQEDFERLAEETRQLLQVGLDGPIPHLIRACERAGIPIAPMVLPGEAAEDTPTDIGHYGISYWSGEAGERALIGYFPGSRADRDRFTIAHEIGHLLLHSRRPRTANAEEEANRFASALLIPLERAQESFTEELTLSDYARLKAVWGVSIQAMIMRSEQIGAISSERKVSLFKQVSARGWRKSEPVTVRPEHPLLLRRLLDFRFGSTPLPKIAEALALPAVLIRSMFPKLDQAADGRVDGNDATVVKFRARARG